MLYNIIIHLYSLAIRFASIFNEKAKLMVNGRKNIFKKIKSNIDKSDKLAWFHCASLGEFEQARPVIEEFKKSYPNYKLLLTFYSPSGYEVRKNYPGVDYIFYLPADTTFNAKKFIALTNPDIVFFVKYEFWYNYISQLYKQEIPVILFSSIFRKNQVFFKPWGGWNRKILKYYKHIFVQNQSSFNLLSEIGISNVSISGDTRYDRVWEIANKEFCDPVIENFINSSKVIVGGSTWIHDEELLCEIHKSIENIKFIIAPHEINPANINRLLKLFGDRSVTYSSVKVSGSYNKDILIIDNIGMLSSIYKYSTIAYIGGAFKTGLHNVLEPAAHGKPVIFGPEYKKFQEAVSLIEMNAAFSINNYNDLKHQLNKLLNNPDFYNITSIKALKFVTDNLGSTTKILTISNDFVI